MTTGFAGKRAMFCLVCRIPARLLTTGKMTPFLFGSDAFGAPRLFETASCRNIFGARGICAFFLVLIGVVMCRMAARLVFLFLPLAGRNCHIYHVLLSHFAMDFVGSIGLQRVITFFERLLFIVRPAFLLVVLLDWGVETFGKAVGFC